MKRQQLTVELAPVDMAALEALASHERRTAEEMITIAVRDYIARRKIHDSEWQRRWDEAIARLRSGVPDGVTPEEIEAEIRAARAEYRAERRARNG